MRISDIRNIKLALEFYWINNNSQYPEYLVYVLFDDFAIEVLNELPIYPIPSIDSECSALGRYEYQRGEDIESYTLSFCLETDVGEADGYYKKAEN
ncbi:MAG: hypothetical protein IIC74_06520 [Bacteroidetes bacterium]|nr:hypothetical protein [Bacteroidota bacterium]